MSELPSVAVTRQFLSECEHQGSQRLAVRLVILGHNRGVALPEVDDWTAWERRPDAGRGRLPGADANPMSMREKGSLP